MSKLRQISTCVFVSVFLSFVAQGGLFARYDTLEEWVNACFKMYKERCREPKAEANVYGRDFLFYFEELETLLHDVWELNPASIKDARGMPFIAKINVPVGSQIAVIGDIHGAIHSLLRNLLRLVALGYLNNDFSINTIDHPNFYMVFLGDLIDRGPYSVDVLYTAFRLKMANPSRVFILGGNHERQEPFDSLKKELYERFNVDIDIYGDFWLRKHLPIGLIIESGDSKVLLCHGGIGTWLNPPVYLRDFINRAVLPGEVSFLSLRNDRDIFTPSEDVEMGQKVVGRFARGLIFADFDNDEARGVALAYTPIPRLPDVFASDPSHPAVTAASRGFDTRIGGFSANNSVTQEFLNNWGLKALLRGHQHSYFGLKIGGEEIKRLAPGQAAISTFSWRDRIGPDGHSLDLQAEALAPGGFQLSNVAYPVFTFTTASSNLIDLTYDSFGILSTGATWPEWRLLPFEFSIEAPFAGGYVAGGVPMSDRKDQYTRVTAFNPLAGNIEDPINFEFTPDARAAGVAAGLLSPLPVAPAPMQAVQDALAQEQLMAPFALAVGPDQAAAAALMPEVLVGESPEIDAGVFVPPLPADIPE